MENTPREFAKILKEQENILLLCHIRPDGDTLGSAYALKYALEAKGKSVTVSCADKIPKRLEFICDLNENERTRNTENAYICALDVAQLHLLGENEELYGKRIDMKIDHHAGGEPYAKRNLIRPDAAACGEIVYEVIRELEKIGVGVLSPNVAGALFAAISSDTGCFKYSNVTAETMRIASELIKAGADNYDINHRLFEIKTRAELAVRRLMLNETEYYLDGRIGILVIDADFRINSGTADDDIGGIVSEIREVEGVDVAVTLKQDIDDRRKFKISMRSSLAVNVNELCAFFGGGGHARAAGASIEADTPSEAKTAVLDVLLTRLG